MRYVNIPKPHTKGESKIKTRHLKISWFGLAALVLFVGIAFLLYLLFGAGRGSNSVFNFIFKNSVPVRSADDKVNILLLGNAGGTHDGPYLTDTIMVASINLKTNQAALISIPRDLWLTKYNGKINSVYEMGLAKGDGLNFSKKVIGDVLGIPIHYAVRIDFRGFIKAVDQVNGLDVAVDNSFDDFHYPLEGKENDLCGFKEEEKDLTADDIKALNLPSPLPSPLPSSLAFLGPEPDKPGKRKVLIDPDGKIATASPEFTCRYEHIRFTRGLTHMGGEAALKYVRSRMGNNGEGTDFARSKRQQKVIEAFKSKLLSFETLVNPAKITALLKTFGQSFETDIPVADALDLYKITKKVDKTSSFVLGDIAGGTLFTNPPSGNYGAWVLLPKNDDFNEVHSYVTKIVDGQISESEATASARPRDSQLP